MSAALFADSLGPGSIVSCRFPLDEQPDIPGPVVRPALILQVVSSPDLRRWHFLTAYGTTRFTRTGQGTDIRVSNPEHVKAAGLGRATRFNLTRLRLLPVGQAFFSYNANQTPMLGGLVASDCARMSKIMDYLRSIAPALDFLNPAASPRLSMTPEKRPNPETDGAYALKTLEQADKFLLNGLYPSIREQHRVCQKIA